MPTASDHSPAGAPSVRTLYIDIRDLYEYARENSTLSGIQRVVANLAQNAPGWLSDKPGMRIALLIPEYARSELFEIDLDAALDLIELLQARRTGRSELDAAIARIDATRRPAKLVAGDVYLMAGAFFICPNFAMMVHLRRQGVIFGLVIYDLISITHPDLVHANARAIFRPRLADALTVAHFVIADSNFVAGEVRTFLQRHMNFTIPVEAVPLATELPPLRLSDEPVDPRVLTLPEQGFVLCVGTIEVRKNHRYLVRIWERLLATFDGEIPALVFVGKWGWNVKDLRRYVKTHDLGGRLRVFNDLSDVSLAHLYRTCLFTVYPSLAEGFGLPVGESLAYGKPCVTSTTTSMPEAGGRFARYVDPRDVDDGAAMIRGLLADRPALAAWTQDVVENFRPRRWREFSTDLFAMMVRLSDQAGAPGRPNTRLEPCIRYGAGDHEARRLQAAGRPIVTLRVACVSGWHSFGNWGCWAASPEAVVRIETSLSAGTPIVLSIILQVPPGSRDVTCTIEAGSGPVRLKIGQGRRAYQAVGRIADGGMLEIRFATAGGLGRPDHRDLYIGLCSLAFCLLDDQRTGARFDALDRSMRARAFALAPFDWVLRRLKL